MPHVVLLGDSVFDNQAYVPGQPDVVRQVRERLPAGWTATLLAVDGDVTTDVAHQLKALPADATHLVVSVGGNDALRHLGVFQEPARSVAAALNRLASIAFGFQESYRAMLEAVQGPGLPLAISTIYYPRFPDRDVQLLAMTALGLFNDVILREAALRGLPVLDLRLICNEDKDYANPIEPSAQGGAKIAGAITTLLAERDFGTGRAEIFVR